jgi:hypothetical protein
MRAAIGLKIPFLAKEGERGDVVPGGVQNMQGAWKDRVLCFGEKVNWLSVTKHLVRFSITTSPRKYLSYDNRDEGNLEFLVSSFERGATWDGQSATDSGSNRRASGNSAKGIVVVGRRLTVKLGAGLYRQAD